MALFTDGELNGIEDLRRYDSGVLDVAATENIDIAAKLTVATETLSMELERFLRDEAGGQRLRLEHVTVTKELRRWHAFAAISSLYSDAHNNDRNERYQRKQDAYRRACEDARQNAFDGGIGIVYKPLSKPKPPDALLRSGTGPARRYYVSVSWTEVDGSESAPSEITVVDATANTVPEMRVTEAAPKHACGWNIYAGATHDSMIRHNSTPIEPHAGWVIGQAQAAVGKPGNGQEPDMRIPRTPMLWRG